MFPYIIALCVKKQPLNYYDEDLCEFSESAKFWEKLQTQLMEKVFKRVPVY
jgi:hypothetical protein